MTYTERLYLSVLNRDLKHQDGRHEDGVPEETDINLNGESIKHTDSFKYLGVVLDDTLSFNDHVDYVRMKVSKILGIFSRQGQGNSDKIERTTTKTSSEDRLLQSCLKTFN